MLYPQNTKKEGELEGERRSDLLFIYTPIECHTTFKPLWSETKKKKNQSGKERLITVQSREKKREEKKG